MCSVRYILHVDADAFFASVEQVLRPELRGKPVIVGASDRGVVSAASYEARRFGIHSAMPVVHARRLCPHGHFVEPNFSAYKEFSERMFAIMRAYSPAVEATSVDEGYIDLTGTLRLHRAPPWEVAHRILHEVRSCLGIDVSGGVAGSKIAAKMATGIAKPNGLIYLEPSRAMVVLGALPVGAVPGVGKKAEGALQRHGIKTVADLVAAQPRLLKAILGRWGQRLAEALAGQSDDPVRSESREAQKSYSKERTLAADTTDCEFLGRVAREMAEKLTERLREDGVAASSVTLKVRYADFTDVSRSLTLKQPASGNLEILECLDRLLPRAVIGNRRVRQVGVKLANITSPPFQENLFDPQRLLRCRRDRAVDTIRDRFGFRGIHSAASCPA